MELQFKNVSKDYGQVLVKMYQKITDRCWL